MTRTIRVAVVDDHPLFREGVIRSLREVEGLEVVGEGASGGGRRAHRRRYRA